MKSTRVYYIFTFLTALAIGVTLTIYVPLMIWDLGFSYADVAMVNAVFWLTIIIAEVPTGALADGRGRGWSVMIGSIIMSISGLVFAFSDHIAGFMVAEALAGVSYAFISGALTSWIADAPDREEELSKVYGKSTMIKGAVYMIAPILASTFVLTYGRWSAFLVCAIIDFTAFIFAWRFMRGKEIEHPISEFEALKFAVRDLRESVSLRWITLIQFTMGIFVIFNLYWTPFLLARVEQIDLAYAWVFMYGSLTLAGWVIHKATPAKGLEGRALLAGLAFTAVPLVILQVSQPLAFIVGMFIVHEFGRGALKPLVTLFIDRRVESAYRATFQSLSSFVGSLGSVLVLGVLALTFYGQEPNVDSISTIWMFGGLALIACVGLFWITRPRYETVD